MERGSNSGIDSLFFSYLKEESILKVVVIDVLLEDQALALMCLGPPCQVFPVETLVGTESFLRGSDWRTN